MSELEYASEESGGNKQRFGISVPTPGAAINLGKPDDGSKFGYPGVSITSAVHLLIDVNKLTLYQSGTSAMWQVGGKWLQYSNDAMYMTTKASATLAADGKVTLAAGAGHGQHTSQTYGQHPRLVDYNNLKLHYLIDAIQNGLKKFIYGDNWKSLEKHLPGSPDGFLKRVHDFEADIRGIDISALVAGTEHVDAGKWRKKTTGTLNWGENLATSYPSFGSAALAMNVTQLVKNTKAFPQLNAFDPFPAVAWGDFGNPVGNKLYNIFVTGPKVLLNTFRRFADVVSMIGAALVDNKLMSKFQNIANMVNAVVERGYFSIKRLDEGMSGSDGARNYGYSFEAETDLVKNHAGDTSRQATVQTGNGPFNVQELYSASGTNLVVTVDNGTAETLTLASSAASSVTVLLPFYEIVLTMGTVTNLTEVTLTLDPAAVSQGATAISVGLDGASESLALSGPSFATGQSISGYSVSVGGGGQTATIQRTTPFVVTTGAEATISAAKGNLTVTLNGTNYTLTATQSAAGEDFVFDTPTLSGYTVSVEENGSQLRISRGAPFTAAHGSEVSVTETTAPGAGEQFVVTIGAGSLLSRRVVQLPVPVTGSADVLAAINVAFADSPFPGAASAGNDLGEVTITQAAGLWTTTFVSVEPAHTGIVGSGNLVATNSGGSFDDPRSVTASELDAALQGTVSKASRSTGDKLTLTTNDAGPTKKISVTGPLSALFSPSVDEVKTRGAARHDSWDDFRAWNFEAQKLPEDLRLMTRPVKNFVDDCVSLASTYTAVMDELMDLLGLLPDSASAVGLFAKDRIVLGTRGDVFATAAAGYTFVVSEEEKKNTDKFVALERPVYWALNFALGHKSFFGRLQHMYEYITRRQPVQQPPQPNADPPRVGFRVLSAGDVRMVAQSSAELLAVGKDGQARVAAMKRVEVRSGESMNIVAGKPAKLDATVADDGRLRLTGRKVELGWFDTTADAPSTARERQTQLVETETLALGAYTTLSARSRKYQVKLENDTAAFERLDAANANEAVSLTLTHANTPTATLAGGNAKVTLTHATSAVLSLDNASLKVESALITASTDMKVMGKLETTGELKVGGALLVKSPTAPLNAPPQFDNVQVKFKQAQTRISRNRATLKMLTLKMASEAAKRKALEKAMKVSVEALKKSVAQILPIVRDTANDVARDAIEEMLERMEEIDESITDLREEVATLVAPVNETGETEV